MNYCKFDGVSNNTTTGLLNQADRLIITLGPGWRSSIEEFTALDPGEERNVALVMR